MFFGKSCLTECLPDTEQLLSFQLKQFADFQSNIVQRTMCRSSPWLLTSRRTSSSCGFYGLHANNCGTCVKKPMTQCSGEEIMREFLYYCGLENKIDEIMPHITAIPVVMPYITSQFMPRKLKDRPEVIPAGNRNLAFIGPFVDLEGDVVFTVETSVRTAMIAVYRMLHLDRPITPLFQGQYDIRMVNVALKTLLGKDKIEVSDLPKVNPLKLPQTMHEIVNAINQIPPVSEYYSERKENQ